MIQFDKLRVEKRINIITLIQIIACLGVFNGHFLMYFTGATCEYLRNSILKYTPASYFFMGDLNVELFFVLGGFLIPLSSAGENFSIKKIIKKWTSLIPPAIILTFSVFLGYWLISIILNKQLPDDTPTKIYQLFDDIFIFLSGKTLIKPKNYDSIPYILSQLWFIFPFLKGWIAAYCLHHLCKGKNLIFFIIGAYFAIIISNASAKVIIGLMFGEFSIKKADGKLTQILIGTALLLICPIIFSSKFYSYVWMKVILYTCFALSFNMLAQNNLNCIFEQMFKKINTLGIYYIHWPVIVLLYHFIEHIHSNCNILPLLYIISLSSTIIFAKWLDSIIFKPIKEIMDKLLNMK